MSWDRNAAAPTALTIAERAAIFSIPEVAEMRKELEKVYIYTHPSFIESQADEM